MVISQTAVAAYKPNLVRWLDAQPSGDFTGNCSGDTQVGISYGKASLVQSFNNCDKNKVWISTSPGDMSVTYVPGAFTGPGTYSTGYVDGVVVKQGTAPYFSFYQSIGFVWPLHSPAFRSCYVNATGSGGTYTC